MNKYLKEYKVSNIRAMIRNGKSKPEIYSDDLKGRLVVISGTTSGIGGYTARKYAAHGADLLCLNRNEEKSKAFCAEIFSKYRVQCNYHIADFSSMAQTKQIGEILANMDQKIDVLIHNAGLYLTKRILTEEGMETVLAVNYLASFILNYMLREKFRKQNFGRILMVNSEGHRFAVGGIQLFDMNWDKRFYTGLRSYGSAKTAQLLSMLVFHDYFADTDVTINAMHPGAVKSNTGRTNGRLYRWFKNNVLEKNMPTPEISAEALYFLGASPKMQGISGEFFSLTTREIPAPPALDRDQAEKLWAWTLEMTGLQ